MGKRGRFHRRHEEALVWSDLCDVAGRMGWDVREEPLADEARSSGGLVRVGERWVFLVEKSLSLGTKCRLLAHCLRRFDLDTISMPPYLREWIQRGGEGEGEDGSKSLP